MKQKKLNVLNSISNKTQIKSFDREYFSFMETSEGFEILDRTTKKTIEVFNCSEWEFRKSSYFYIFTKKITKKTPIRDFFYNIKEHFYWNWYIYLGIIIFLVLVVSGTLNVIWFYKFIKGK